MPGDHASREYVDDAQRHAIGMGLRMQASTLKGLAETMRQHAVELEQHADSIEKGASTAPRPVRQRPRDDEEGLALVPIDGNVLQTRGIDALDVSTEMKVWLRQFHPRFRSSPHFAAIIGDMAIAQRPMNDDTAQEVAGLVQAREQAAHDRGDEHG